MNSICGANPFSGVFIRSLIWLIFSTNWKYGNQSAPIYQDENFTDGFNVIVDVKTQMDGRMSNENLKPRTTKSSWQMSKLWSYVQFALEQRYAGIRKEIVAALKSMHLNSEWHFPCTHVLRDWSFLSHALSCKGSECATNRTPDGLVLPEDLSPLALL